MNAVAKNFQAIGHGARFLAISGACYAMLSLMLLVFLSQTAMQKAAQVVR
jgi:hypothetical protein